MSHRFPRLRFFQHNPSGPAVVRAIVDHVVITGTALGFVGDTALLFATAYNAKGVVIPGVSVDWSSSQPGMISVIAGLCTFLVPGTATITATVDGRAYTTSAICARALVPTLDFAPLARRTDLARPAVYTTIDGTPQHLGAGLLNQGSDSRGIGAARVSYPKTADEWGFVATTIDRPSDAPPADIHFGSGTNVPGPYAGVNALSILPTDANQHFTILDARWRTLSSADNQDVSAFRRSVAAGIAARTAADIGKTVRLWLGDQITLSAFNNWTASGAPSTLPVAHADVVLSAAFQWVNIPFPDSASLAATGNPALVVTMDPANPQIVGYLVYPLISRSWAAEESDPANWIEPLPFHETLGVQNTDIYCQCWNEDSDSPTLYNPSGTSAKATTAIAAPDSLRFFGGRTVTQFTLGVGDGITTAAPIRIEDNSDSPLPPILSNVPVQSAWTHWYIKPAPGHALPLDTDLAAYLIASGTATVAEDTVQRVDNPTSAGSMDTGQAWVPATGTWSVVSHTLQLAADVSNGILEFDTGKSDCTIDVTFAAITGGDDSVIVRYVDALNFWRVMYEAGVLYLQQWAAGNPTNVTSATISIVNGDRIGAILAGNSISPTHNETVIGAMVATNSFNATATRHGIGANNTGTHVSHFKVTASSASAATYGPIPLVRDATRYGMQNGTALVSADGSQFFRARTPFNLASEGYLDFTPRIVNVSSGPLVFNAYRVAVTTEADRDLGLHSAWVPRRTITTRQFGDSAFEIIENIQTIMTPSTLVWITRQVIPWSFGDIENLNGAGTGGYHPSLWQSGPYGSSDFTFHCDVQPLYDGTFTMDITVARGSPTPNPQDFMSWSIQLQRISIAQASTAWPKMVAFDMAVAALNGVPQCLGIGLGTGTAIQWLNDGDTFLGGTVQYQHSAGTAWAFDGGLGTGAGLGHIGLAADLDRVRQTNGWVQAIFAANTVPSNTAGLQRSIELQISKKWGARLDHRVAA